MADVPVDHLRTYTYRLPDFALTDSSASDTIRTFRNGAVDTIVVWVGHCALPTSPGECTAWSVEVEAEDLIPDRTFLLVKCYPQIGDDFCLQGAFDWWLRFSYVSDGEAMCVFSDTVLAWYHAFLLERDHPDATDMIFVINTVLDQELVINDVTLLWDSSVNAGDRLRLPNDGLRVYPNPAHNLLTVEGHNQGIILYNILGREVFRELHRSQYRLPDFPTGVYFLHVECSTGPLIHKINIVR